MNQLDSNSRESSAISRKPRYVKEYPLKENLDESERDEIDRRERLILPLARKRFNKERIGRKEVKDVAGKIGRKIRNVQEMIGKYVAQMQKYKDNPERWGDCLGDNRGRPAGTSETLDDEGMRAIVQALHDRNRIGVYADGITKQQVELPPGLDITEDIYQYALSLCSTLPSLDTVEREVKRRLAENPSYYKLILEGENALRREDSPKLPFEVDNPDDLWGYDICDLPNYVNDEGLIATAAIIRMIDYKTDYRIHQRLIPKKEQDENGTLLGVSFKKTDVIVFFVSAMWKVKRRPRSLYPDNDARLNLGDEFPFMTEPGETPIEMKTPRPEEPWVRGLLEGGFSRSQIKLLRRYPGYYIKRNRSSIRKAISSPSKLPPSKVMEGQVAKFDANMNNEPRVQPARGKPKGPTRGELYHQFVNPRPCPPIRRLFRVMPEDHREENWISLDGLGFDFAAGGEKHFIPIAASIDELPDLWINWMDAKLSKELCHYYAIKLDFGWVAEIHLRGHWYEAVPRSQNPYSPAMRKQAIDKAVSKLKQRVGDETARILAEALERDGAYPERDNVSVRGEYSLPPRTSSKDTSAVAEGQEADQMPAQAGQDTNIAENAAGSAAMSAGPDTENATGDASLGSETPSDGKTGMSTSSTSKSQETKGVSGGASAPGAEAAKGSTDKPVSRRRRGTSQQSGEQSSTRKTKLDWEDLF